MAESTGMLTRSPLRQIMTIGAGAIKVLEFIGGVAWLVADIGGLLIKGVCSRKVRLGMEAYYQQLLRIGVRSISIILLLSSCIGMILVLQMSPPLAVYGQEGMVANIVVVAVLRELGPLISAVVLTGFAGASIAAELGTMVVGEEIEALESMALDPIRFLVVPRVTATVLGLVILCAMADVVSVGSGMLMGVTALGIPAGVYWNNTLTQASLSDFLTGLVKAGVFGMLLGSIACYNGLRVRGGAAGVGLATTITVVYAVVSIIFADLLFTALFYALGFV